MKWQEARETYDGIRSAAADQQDGWVALGLQLLDIRAEYKADKAFGDAAREEIPRLSPQKRSAAMWLASLTRDSRRELFDRYPDVTNPDSLRASASRDEWVPAVCEPEPVANGSLPQVFDTPIAETPETTVQSEDTAKPDATNNDEKIDTPSGKTIRERLLLAFTNRKTPFKKMSENQCRGNKVLVRIDKLLQEGLIEGHGRPIKYARGTRWIKPNDPERELKTVKAWMLWMDKELGLAEPAVQEPPPQASTKPTYTRIIVHGQQAWPPPYVPSTITDDMAKNMAWFLEAMERDLLHKEVDPATLRHVMITCCRFIEPISSDFAALVRMFFNHLEVYGEGESEIPAMPPRIDA